MPALGSKWDGLSRSLIAQLYPVKMDVSGSSRIFTRVGDISIEFPISEASIEQTANWTSPFENQTADSGLGTFSSMLQVGGFIPVISAFQKKTAPGSGENNALQATKNAAASLIGASSVTKLNSTAVYSGSPQMKLSMTAHFRALKSARDEVETPISQLMEWLLPEELAEDGVLTNLANGNGIVRSIFPSRSPTLVAFSYAGRLYSPMVIENVSHPVTVPMDSAGNAIHKSVQLTVCSMSAIDRADWRAIMTGGRPSK